MIRNNKKHTGVSLIMCLFSIIIIFACSGFVIDMGILLIVRSELQKAVETTALAVTSTLEPDRDMTNDTISLDVSNTHINTLVQTTFNTIKSSNSFIKAATLEPIEIKPMSKAVRLTADIDVRPVFMSIVGLHTITVKARAAALNFPVYLDPRVPRVPTIGSLVNGTGIDTNVANSKNIFYAPDGNVVNFANKTTNITTAGHLTARLPMPIVDNQGADLFIHQTGSTLQGYFLYIGVDVDPRNPYISDNNKGSDIKWINISCTGSPASGAATNGNVGSYLSNVKYANNTYLITQAKFYGSGLFDMGKKCYDGGTLVYDGTYVKTAKYIKIVDDGIGDGFNVSGTQIPSGLSGIQIDDIAVLHHSRLIKSSEFGVDTDGDGLIDILENMLGTSNSAISGQDTDGDGYSDAVEYVGHNGLGTPITTAGSTAIGFSCARDTSR